MDSTVSFKIPAKREFVGLVRLAIGGLSQVAPFDVDATEDLKLVMSEICTSMINSSEDADTDLSFSITLNKAELTVEVDSVEAVNEMVSATSSGLTKAGSQKYSLSIIMALMDKVELLSDGNGHSVLRLKKFF